MKQIQKISTLVSLFIIAVVPSAAALAAKCTTADGGKTVDLSLFPGSCKTGESCLYCWERLVFTWAQGAILLTSTIVIIFAGITYMTSAGSPKRIETAKKLITGALVAVGVIVLGRFFLVYVLGVPWLGKY